MKFDELDARMRVFETAHDHCVLPGVFMVARLDGRGFTRLTRELHDFDAPFDERFRDHMIATTRELMDAGFRVVYGYTESDEISLLFHRGEDQFGRKLRKFDSVLAGVASSAFSLSLGAPAVFDCRVSQLPAERDVVDYFRWRSEDAHRNALNGHCYWHLRKAQGLDARAATRELAGRSIADKNELLFKEAGFNFSDAPAWQRRGVGLRWDAVEVEGVDPRDHSRTRTTRRRIAVDLELPMKDAYDGYVLERLREAQSGA